MSGSAVRITMFFGVALFVIGALMHVRRCSLHGQYAAWARDHLATKCIPRVRNASTTDAVKEMAFDEVILLQLAKTKEYAKLTDVFLCHLMESFYDREADAVYQQADQLEQFLLDYYLYSRKCDHKGATIVGYLQNLRENGQDSNVVKSLLDLFQNPDPALDTVNIPPPRTQVDYAGNEMPVSKHYDYKESVAATKSLPAMAHYWKNLSMEMAGAPPETIHPVVGMTVAEIDKRYQEIVARTGPF